jgi:hypothetical protein
MMTMKTEIRQKLQEVRQQHRPRAVRFWHVPTFQDRSATLHMFTQDIHAMVMPPKGGSQREIEIGISGSEKGKARVLLLLASIAHHERYHEDEAISDVVQTIANYLATFGEVVFEIVRDENREALALSAFTPDSVRNAAVGWVQWIPPRERQHMEEPERFLFFRRTEVFAVSLPRSLGGRAAHRRTLKKLARFESIGPKFLQADIEKGKWQAGVEIGDYHRKKRSFDYILTNRWGWNGRDASLQYVTEFYQIWRWLRFQNALAILREHVVQQLNLFFLAENIEARITLAGIPTQNDMSSCKSRLLKGKMGFKDVYEALRL